MNRIHSEKIYCAIGDSIDYGVWICAPDGRNIYASDSFLRLVGLTQKECSDLGWGAVLHPDDAERTISAWQECVRNEGVWDIEHRFRGVDGQWHPVLTRGVPVRDKSGEIICWAGINLDLSRKRQVDEAARLSGANLQLALEAAHLATWDWQIQSGTMNWNNEHFRMLGYEPDSFIPAYHHWADRVHPDDLQATEALIQQTIKNGDDYRAEFRVILPDGRVSTLESLGRVEQDQAGTSVRLYGAMSDVTERIKTVDELRLAKESLEERVSERTAELSLAILRLNQEIDDRKQAELEREQFYRFFVASADIMVIADPNGTFLKINPACTSLLGYPEEELLSKPFIDFVHPDDRQATLDEMARQQQSGHSLAFENRYVCKDGSFLWISWSAIYKKDENCTYATGRDITGNKFQEEALRNSEQAFRQLAEAMPQIVWVTRADGWNIYFNQQWMDYTGLTLGGEPGTWLEQAVSSR